MLGRRRRRQLDQLTRRLEDLEDTVAAALDRGLVDDLTERLDELTLVAVIHDDLLRLRTENARVAAELTKVRAELQDELDQVRDAVEHTDDPHYRRRAAG